MPQLQHRRHEWFAQFRASGDRLEEAYEKAGYVASRAHASRLAAREEVAMRINELRAQMNDFRRADPREVINDLMRLASACVRLDTPHAFREARAAMLAAARLEERQAKALQRDREILERELGRMASSELDTPEEPERGSRRSGAPSLPLLLTAANAPLAGQG